MKNMYLIVINLMLTCSIGYAQQFDWAFQLGNGTANEFFDEIRLDNQNNLLVTGYFLGSMDADPSAAIDMLNPAGSSPVFLGKYDENGNYIWGKYLDGYGSSSISGMDTDAANNIFVCGFYTDSIDMDPSANTAMLYTSTSYADIFIAKYDPMGNFIWAKTMGGSRFDASSDLEIDNNGDLVVLGTFKSTADFDPSAATYNMSSLNITVGDIFLAKYDTSGNFIWAKEMDATSGTSFVNDLEIDHNNNYYIAGGLRSTVDLDPSANVANFTSGSSYDIFYSKYDENGAYIHAGIMLGTATSGADIAKSIKVDANENIYLLSEFAGLVAGNPIDFDPGPGTAILTAPGQYPQIAISKYDATGNYVWAYQLGDVFDDQGEDMILTDDGYLYITGKTNVSSSGSIDFDFHNGVFNLQEDGIYIAKYETDSCGFQWAVGTGSWGSVNSGLSLDVDQSGNVFYSARFQNTVDFNMGVGNYNLTATNSTLDGAISRISEPCTTSVSAYDSLLMAGSITICEGEAVTFANGSTNATVYIWEVDGQSFSNLENPTYTFTTAGNFQISLIAKNGSCADTMTAAFQVNAVAFGATQANMCQGDSILLGGAYQYISGVYYDTLMASNSCDSIVETTLTVSPCTDVLENGLEVKISVYPNPTKGQLTIRADEIGVLQIRNSIGQLIKSTSIQFNTVELDLSAYEKGMYFISVQSQNGVVVTEKVILQ
jgi:PKD repeat protein